MIRQLSFLLILIIPFIGFSQIFEENFDNVDDLENEGWVLSNLSEPDGVIGWFQGNPDTFSSYEGAADSYVAANFNNTGITGIISNWLIMPAVEVKDGDILSFYTRVPENTIWNDRLEVRSSIGDLTIPTNGSDDIGSFTNVELIINDDMNLSYPEEWTRFEIEVDGIGQTPQEVYFAFRYNVDNSTGNESNYIGIDSILIEGDENGDDYEECEWTVKVWTYETFADDISWELRNADGVILSGNDYDLMFVDEQSVTAAGPVEFYISTIGDSGDNEVNYRVSNESGELFSGHLDPNEEITHEDMFCEDEGIPIDEDEYCQPFLDCTSGDMITNVTFQEIDNDSECSESEGGYGNYTDQIANVVAGETYPISVTVGDGWEVESVSVWIDFDQSGTFDEDEFFYIGTGSDETLSSEINIPGTIEEGEYRMRVRVAAVGAEDATWDKACDTNEDFFGETEDYTVSVGEMSTSSSQHVDFTFYPNPVKDFLIIQSEINVQSAVIYNLIGQQVLNTTQINNGQIEVQSLSEGIYFMEVAFENGAKERFKIIKE